MHHRPSRRTTRLVVALALVLVAGACSGGDSSTDGAGAGPSGGTDGTAAIAGDSPGSAFDEPLTVVVANTPGTLSVTGTQRVMTALVGDGPNAYLGGADQPVSVRFSAINSDAGGEVAGEWLTTNASSLGLYVTPFAFTEAGLWEVTVVAGESELGTGLVEVVEQSSVPDIGDPAPPSVTPTAASESEIEAISTDLDPDPSFYDLSIADAVDNGRPTVIAFATPAFCQTALCGPTLDFVKAAVDGRNGLDVVHVEPFDLEAAAQGTLEPIPAMLDWGLVTEPWVFVVDADGRVAASFEGVIGQAELERAIDQL